ncbi:amino acid ABC transporter ATP-binding/permease protein [Rhizobium alvei]|uniref:ATP-binding cassette domain-containing protein n=1 Tax=Rhizobium alvei TaxID=1132659 RepID=A0ABT8YHK7_9HYPH|nr:ATP-binding cassette domain-containing protein [Rhizobium alvei]MDO6962902.1 ATP-binding cassette domain-containing protein [Rhizobium alvei]
MKRLFRIAVTVWKPHAGKLLLGALLSVLVLAMGLSLLGLSGWFITASGLAGLAGLGIAFDVFRPSAMIRFLALGRAGTRYGERLYVHDATLRGLAELRLRLLNSMSHLPVRRMSALNGSERLNHLTTDVDALDGIASRLLIPLIAAAILLPAAFAIVWRMAGIAMALSQTASLLVGVIAAFALTTSLGRKPSRRAHRAMQAVRLRFIDTLRAQSETIMEGEADRAARSVLAAHDRLQAAQKDVDRSERLGSFVLAAAATTSASLSLLLAILLARSGALELPLAAAGFFVALALPEVTAPLVRAAADYARMADAARRIDPQLHPEPSPERAAKTGSAVAASAPVLAFDHITFRQGDRIILRDFSLSLQVGETVALVGESGVGKSTLLLLAAGQMEPEAGHIHLHGRAIGDWAEPDLLRAVTYLPQRSALMSGTIFEALQLARPDLTVDEAWSVLSAVALDRVIDARGGLASRLTEAGAGLSGGEQRRLTLARALLRRPSLLLLDEPTEGLDEATAETVLKGIRAYLEPETAILLASHRAAERRWADRNLLVSRPSGA